MRENAMRLGSSARLLVKCPEVLGHGLTRLPNGEIGTFVTSIRRKEHDQFLPGHDADVRNPIAIAAYRDGRDPAMEAVWRVSRA